MIFLFGKHIFRLLILCFPNKNFENFENFRKNNTTFFSLGHEKHFFWTEFPVTYLRTRHSVTVFCQKVLLWPSQNKTLTAEMEVERNTEHRKFQGFSDLRLGNCVQSAKTRRGDPYGPRKSCLHRNHLKKSFPSGCGRLMKHKSWVLSLTHPLIFKKNIHASLANSDLQFF